LEIGHQFPPALVSMENIFRQEIYGLIHQIGLR